MLVLSRKASERIRLGDSIVITVVRVSGDKVRLGIDAPPDVLVLREELQPRQDKPIESQTAAVPPGSAQLTAREVVDAASGLGATAERAVA